MSSHGYSCGYGPRGFSGSRSNDGSGGGQNRRSGPEYEKAQLTESLHEAWGKRDALRAAALGLSIAEICRRQWEAAFGDPWRVQWENDAHLLEQNAWRDARQAFETGQRKEAIAVLQRIAAAQHRLGRSRDAWMLEKTIGEWLAER